MGRITGTAYSIILIQQLIIAQKHTLLFAHCRKGFLDNLELKILSQCPACVQGRGRAGYKNYSGDKIRSVSD